MSRSISVATAMLSWATVAALALVAGCPAQRGARNAAGSPNADGSAADGPAPTGSPGDGNVPTSCGPLLEVPDPLSGENPTYKISSVRVPAPGSSVTDAAFGTAQTRVVQTVGLRHEYSRHDPFNQDQSLILLLSIPDGQWRIYRTTGLPYDQPGNLVRTADLDEPRWDPNDRTLLWGVQGFRLVTLNVQTGGATVIKDFAADPIIAPLLAANPDIYRITMKDEGEPSIDHRYWAFILQGTQQDYRPRYVFCWDRQDDRILGIRQVSASEADIDWVGMSPLGNWVLIGGSELNSGNLAGLVMADRELTTFHRIDYATAHADVGLDTDGNEVVVMQNIRTDYIDLIPLSPETLPILEPGGSYAGTNRVPLVRLYYADSPIGLRSGVHISCNRAGYCVVSTHIEPGAPEQNWLDRTIVLVRLDRQNPRAYYLAKVYGTTAAYWEETHATITRDGSRVLFATNWGQDVGQEHVWDMELRTPTGWFDAPHN
jgi:hypothetical protein